MKILTFLYKREIMYTVQFILLILGIMLYMGLYRISRRNISIILSLYCGIIFGSLLGFVLSGKIVIMILGAVVCSILFYIFDRIFNNEGMFISSFICIFDTFYLLAMGILYEYIYLVIPHDKREDFADSYFDINSYEIRYVVFVLAIGIAVVISILLAIKVKKINVFYFMVILFATFRVCGMFFGSSYAIYPYEKVKTWGPVYLSILTLDYSYFSLFFLAIIVFLTTIVYKARLKNIHQ